MKLYTRRKHLEELNSFATEVLHYNFENFYASLENSENVEIRQIANAIIDIKTALETIEIRLAKLENREGDNK